MTRKTRKDVELEISSERAEELYSDLLKWSGNEFAGRWFEGSLLDEFAVVMTSSQDWKINLSKGRPILARKYVYVYEKYLNSWSSELRLALTDNKDKFLEFVKSRFNDGEDLDDLDYENFCYEAGLDEQLEWIFGGRVEKTKKSS